MYSLNKEDKGHHDNCSCHECLIHNLVLAAGAVLSSGAAKKSRFNKGYCIVPETEMERLRLALNEVLRKSP